jgi:hypothetical protein
MVTGVAVAAFGRGRILRMPLPVLVLAQTSAETDELLRECEERHDIWTLRVATVSVGTTVLRDARVSLVIVGPEAPAADASALLVEVSRLRPGVPVLVIRSSCAEESASWMSSDVAVLRCPLLPGVLSRSVDVALGLAISHRARCRVN